MPTVEVDESGMNPVALALGAGSTSEASSDQSNTIINQGIKASKMSNLNPGANEFHPRQAPENTRTMFVTFSQGHPLSREEIVHFSTSKWGAVVQNVAIEHTLPGQEPQFGRTVFTTSSMIPRVLNGQAKAKCLVN